MIQLFCLRLHLNVPDHIFIHLPKITTGEHRSECRIPNFSFVAELNSLLKHLGSFQPGSAFKAYSYCKIERRHSPASAVLILFMIPKSFLSKFCLDSLRYCYLVIAIINDFINYFSRYCFIFKSHRIIFIFTIDY